MTNSDYSVVFYGQIMICFSSFFFLYIAHICTCVQLTVIMFLEDWIEGCERFIKRIFIRERGKHSELDKM